MLLNSLIFSRMLTFYFENIWRKNIKCRNLLAWFAGVWKTTV